MGFRRVIRNLVVLVIAACMAAPLSLAQSESPDQGRDLGSDSSEQKAKDETVELKDDIAVGRIVSYQVEQKSSNRQTISSGEELLSFAYVRETTLEGSMEALETNNKGEVSKVRGRWTKHLESQYEEPADGESKAKKPAPSSGTYNKTSGTFERTSAEKVWNWTTGQEQTDKPADSELSPFFASPFRFHGYLQGKETALGTSWKLSKRTILENAPVLNGVAYDEASGTCKAESFIELDGKRLLRVGFEASLSANTSERVLTLRQEGHFLFDPKSSSIVLVSVCDKIAMQHQRSGIDIEIINEITTNIVCTASQAKSKPESSTGTNSKQKAQSESKQAQLK